MTTTIEDEFIGKKLKLRRIMMGISQNFLGKTEKISYQQIQKYEAGKNRIPSTRLYSFSKFLRVPVTYFFEGIEIVLNTNHKDCEKHFLKQDLFLNDQKIKDLKRLNNNFSKIKNKNSRKTIINLTKDLLKNDLITNEESNETKN